jgi:predicted ATPase
LAAPLGHHFAQAEEAGKAIYYLQKAAEQAVYSNANQEAITYFNKILSLLESLPDSPNYAQQELKIQIAVGRLLFAIKGYGNSEGLLAFERALVLAQKVGDPRQRFAALYGLWGFHAARASLQQARKEAEELLDLAQRSQHPTLLLWSHMSMSMTLFWLGEITAAKKHQEKQIEYYDPQRHGPQFRRVTEDPGVNGQCYLALNLWLLGYPDQSLAQSQGALSIAQNESHLYTLAFACTVCARLHQLRRENEQVKQYAETAIKLSTEQKFPLLLAWGKILKGWALAAQGQAAEGLTQIERGLEILRATETNLTQTYFLSLQIEAFLMAGQIDAGLNIVKEILNVMGTTGERLYESKLYQLRGELYLAHQDSQAKAVADFQQAIATAHQQSARMFELRAATSLAKVWQAYDKKKEAQQMLSQIYDQFTEGFDTFDMQEARTLIEKLSR